MNRHVLSCAIAILLVIMSCRTQYIYYSGDSTVASMELTVSDISGWSAVGNFEIVVGQELYGKIDGGAPVFLDNGMIEAGYQQLNGSKNETVNTVVMDFGSNENAQNMYLEIKSKSSDQSVFPSFPLSIAYFNSQTMSGCAVFKNFFIQIDASSGFSDKLVAVQTMDMFLRIYRAKI